MFRLCPKLTELVDFFLRCLTGFGFGKNSCSLSHWFRTYASQHLQCLTPTVFQFIFAETVLHTLVLSAQPAVGIMTWLSGTTMLHSALGSEKKGRTGIENQFGTFVFCFLKYESFTTKNINRNINRRTSCSPVNVTVSHAMFCRRVHDRNHFLILTSVISSVFC